ncbi:RDD family protein [Geodermatophilus marinus]|uniref:RDD family protein n=1 Tax=Geodermatophilus sp. LHW52908 TaxID=2303986 RepID=UPI000E3E6129|nr:RDD family protein [Geodermatophilus sp. LHW52908]RFU20429.1 RDD family protein [Geodermatophilus sp. LHW52908]
MDDESTGNRGSEPSSGMQAPSSGRPPPEELAPARLPARVAAGSIDLLVVVAAVAAVGQPFPPILPLGVFVLYHGTLTWWTGQTLGKALLGLRVVRPGGNRSAWWAFARSGPGYLLLGLAGLGLLTSAFDRDHRALYDIALGGAVVQETDAVNRPRGLLDRLVAYAEAHQKAATERTKTLTVLLALWAWVAGLGKALQKVLDVIRGSPPTRGPSALATVSSKAAAAVAATATVVATAFPLAGAVGTWLFTDIRVFGEPPAPTGAAADLPATESSGDAVEAFLEDYGFRPTAPCQVLGDPGHELSDPAMGVRMCYVLTDASSTVHTYRVAVAFSDVGGASVTARRSADGTWSIRSSPEVRAWLVDEAQRGGQ